MNLIELFFYKLFEFYKNIFFLYLYFYFIYLNIFLLNLILYIYLDLKEKKNVYFFNQFYIIKIIIGYFKYFKY